MYAVATPHLSENRWRSFITTTVRHR